MNQFALSLAAMCLMPSFLPLSAQTLEETAWKGCQTFDLCDEKPKQSPDEGVSGVPNSGQSLKTLASGGTKSVAMTAKDVPSPSAANDGGDSLLTRMGKGAEHGFNGTALIGPTWILKAAKDFEESANRANNPLSTGGYESLFVLTCVGAGIAGIAGGIFGAIFGAPAGAIAEAVSPGSTKDWEK